MIKSCLLLIIHFLVIWILIRLHRMFYFHTINQTHTDAYIYIILMNKNSKMSFMYNNIKHHFFVSL